MSSFHHGAVSLECLLFAHPSFLPPFLWENGGKLISNLACVLCCHCRPVLTIILLSVWTITMSAAVILACDRFFLIQPSWDSENAANLALTFTSHHAYQTIDFLVRYITNMAGISNLRFLSCIYSSIFSRYHAIYQDHDYNVYYETARTWQSRSHKLCWPSFGHDEIRQNTLQLIEYSWVTMLGVNSKLSLISKVLPCVQANRQKASTDN